MAEGTEEKRKVNEISSFIADLPSAVQKFWGGVAQPLFELSITLVVVFFALGGDAKVEEAISTQLGKVPKISFGEGYGIKTLIPFAVLIFLVGIAQGVSKLLRVIGAAIPGRLVPNRTNLFLVNGEIPEMVEAWQYNSSLGTVQDLNIDIDATICASAALLTLTLHLIWIYYPITLKKMLGGHIILEEYILILRFRFYRLVLKYAGMRINLIKRRLKEAKNGEAIIVGSSIIKTKTPPFDGGGPVGRSGSRGAR